MMMVILSAILVLLSFHGSVDSADTCRKKDIMVVVELPPSQRYASYYAKSFIQEMERKMKPNQDCLQIGFIFAWTRAEKIIPLDCDYKRCYTKGISAANNVIYESSRLKGTYDKRTTAAALRMAEEELVNKGKWADQLLVLVLSTPPSKSAVKTEDEVKDTLDLGIKVLAVGVGEGRQENLLEITSSGYLPRELSSFREFSKKASLIDPGNAPVVAAYDGVAKPMSSTDPGTVCQNKVDIGFLVDSSASVGNHFGKEKEFVQMIATRFGISKNGSHAGVIVFSEEGKVETRIKFNEHLTTDSFIGAVQNLPCCGRRTRIDRALTLAATELFSGYGGSRANVKKLLFLITDGKQNPAYENSKAINLAKIAEKLHSQNVKIYCVGVGPKASIKELNSIAKDTQKVFNVTDFKALIGKEFVNKVSEQLCKEATIGDNITTICPKKNSTRCCKNDDCDCCGNRPVYINIFQGENSRNHVNQGQTVEQSGNGNSAGGLGETSENLTGEKVKAMSNEEIVAYMMKLLPSLDSMNQNLKELLTRTIVNKKN